MRRGFNRMHPGVHLGMPFEGSLHTGIAVNLDDPRRLGILQKTRCRPYRDQLRSTQHSNMMQGLMIVTAAATVMAVLWFHFLELASETDSTKSPGSVPSQGQDQDSSPSSSPSPSDSQLQIGTGILQSLWLGAVGIFGLNRKHKKDQSAREFYCNQELDTKRIFRQIARQVLNQEHALARLERVVKSPRKFKSAALLGPPGVGKSLTAIGLRQQFPWQENVHSYSWSTYVPDGVHKFHMIRNFVEHLSDCGQNLLIIDNLSTCDYGIVPIYNKLLVEREGDLHAAANQTVLVVYIFNLEMEYYWQQFELLQQLPVDMAIINYRPFGRDELSDCLQQELRFEQRTLDPGKFSQIIEQAFLNVQCTGCKSLRQLVLQHGQPEPNQ